MTAEFITALLVAQAAPVPPPPVVTPPSVSPPACDSEGHAGFDFWVGEWNVYGANREQMVARSTIVRRHNGCAVIEHWQPLRGQGGTSLNSYDAASGQWHQKWVGSSPGAVDFIGGVVERKMVLTGNWPSPQVPHQLIRMTYTANEDGSVRQFGEGSTDHGLTWTTSFDFLYRPRSEDSE